ncbi:MAG: manganese efflux pump MntP family protein [Clostridia bacterium]|nr:manganese efflux pump MntP family protein [Clostridia bacterium]
MEWNFMFFINSILFGVGLAMDAFSVSMANGLNEPDMSRKRMVSIAGTFSLFQILMPLLGWICIHTIAQAFTAFQKFIPWIALLLLAFIGGKMLLEGIKGGEEEEASSAVGFAGLMLQGVATSIDALSVGFTIAEYSAAAAIVESLIIGIVTLFICLGGLRIGRKFGTKLAGKASILGGVILIAIGLEIFITGVF